MALDFSKYTGHHKAACDSCEFYEYDEECDAYGNCELCRATWLYDHGCRMEINEEKEKL